MSRETQQWLDEMIKVGFTAPEHGRGEPWHRKPGNANSYPHAVPYKDAYELIASWYPKRVTPMWDDEESNEFRVIKDFRGKSPVALLHSENNYFLGMHTDGYATHGYAERLFGGLEKIFDESMTDGLQIGSCGLLNGYKRAWVQLELPNSVEHSEGVMTRPFITAASSLDGSLATTYLKGETLVVCDNTLDMAMWGASHKLKVKNTTNSQLKINDAREALDLVFKIDEVFEESLKGLLSIKVPERAWNSFLDLYVPIPEEDGRGKTRATKKRDALDDMYHNDPMVAPWSGTAWGVTQAVSTYAEHLQMVQSATRGERNIDNFIRGRAAERDQSTLLMLQSVLS